MKHSTILSPYLQRELKRLERDLRQIFKSAPQPLAKPTLLLLRAGGKRLRPALVILSAMAGNYNYSRVVIGAVAVELVHLASLVHDDILDGAKTRRGLATINSIYGYKNAITVGDYLFGKAFSLIASLQENKIIESLAQAAHALSFGELLQLESSGNPAQDQNEYLQKIYCKTASLFKAACEIGALIGRVSAVERNSLSKYGHHIGIAFQIYDDILDLVGNEKILGKSVGTDLREGTVTLPMLFALREKGAEVLCEAIKKPTEKKIQRAMDFIKKTSALEESRDVANIYVDKALRAIVGIRNEAVRDELFSLGKFVIERGY